MNLWPLIKDILLTATGAGVIIYEMLSGHPSDVLLVSGLALTVPALASHASSVLGAGSGQHSSLPPGTPTPPRSGTSQQGDGDGEAR